jgi:AhpD family alkylhydroperoxidase
VAHIELGNDEPGIRGLLTYRPETAGPLMQLAEVLLRGDSTLSRGERELIAAYVSRRNDCAYCTRSHSATAAAQLPGGTAQVERALAGLGADAGAGAGADAGTDAGTDPEADAGTDPGTDPGAGLAGAPVSGKLGALLEIAGLVQVSGRMVTADAVAKAHAEGATDLEIHDTVLIAAAFSMFNRYVDGLGAPLPDDPAQYAAAARFLVEHGYQMPR